ncbi:uncharacterized protein ARMOST_17684 [Armillaria ostoyae]|uniref:Uncharacterized protein n=1 Tax=Armillaria ostoyae TaxID=47428 RepID=A0A284RZN9_ARMOS|nr:uncharacterized protein ARMOST_17684 [Armillaria ostoyae]
MPATLLDNVCARLLLDWKYRYSTPLALDNIKHWDPASLRRPFGPLTTPPSTTTEMSHPRSALPPPSLDALLIRLHSLTEDTNSSVCTPGFTQTMRHHGGFEWKGCRDSISALRVVGVIRVAAMVTFSSKTVISSSKKILRLPFSPLHLGPVYLFKRQAFPSWQLRDVVDGFYNQQLQGGMLLPFTAIFPLRFYQHPRISAGRRAHRRVSSIAVAYATGCLKRAESTIESRGMVYTSTHMHGVSVDALF